MPFLAPSQAQKHVTHNEALQRLDVLTQLAVEEVDATGPPATPDIGAIYALGAAPTGAWTAAAGQLAYWTGGGWLFIPPQEGWRAWDRSSAALRIYAGGTWESVSSELQNLEGLGIGASSDAVNRLAVAAEATLFSHEGAGHQLKLNKAATAETASLLYQSDWTGHAEMGLTGDTDFRVKVLADGSIWHDALYVEAGTGRVRFPNKAVPAPARAYVSTTTAQVVASSTNTWISYETAVYDTTGFYTASAPDRLTVPTDGGYELDCVEKLQMPRGSEIRRMRYQSPKSTADIDGGRLDAR